MHLGHLVTIAVIGVSLGGCASIVKGGSQSITITTPPTTGANCMLSSSQGHWTVVSPNVVTVSRSKEDMAVHCSKTGWQDATATIPSNFDGWTIGNLVFGGLIGVGIDAATGAINEYPNTFQVPMLKVESAPAAQPSQSDEKKTPTS